MPDHMAVPESLPNISSHLPFQAEPHLFRARTQPQTKERKSLSYTSVGAFAPFLSLCTILCQNRTCRSRTQSCLRCHSLVQSDLPARQGWDPVRIQSTEGWAFSITHQDPNLALLRRKDVWCKAQLRYHCTGAGEQAIKDEVPDALLQKPSFPLKQKLGLPDGIAAVAGPRAKQEERKASGISPSGRGSIYYLLFFCVALDLAAIASFIGQAQLLL
eukprot:1160878-Pelagomonas_calceolata.AAC.8